MYKMVTDPETGEQYGWGRVLDYIGVGWEDIPETQMTIFDVFSDDELYGKQIRRISEYAKRMGAISR